MFEKIIDKQYKNKFVKSYKSMEKYDVMTLINLLKENDKNIINVYIAENADIGLKSFEGNYSFDDFLKKYNEINKNEISSIIVYLDSNDKLYINNGNYISLSSEFDTELSDLLASKSKKM